MSWTPPAMITSKERDEYGKALWKIQEHMKTWVVFAEAMRDIRTKRLYLVECPSFEQFCCKYTNYTVAWVHQLIAAYEVFERYTAVYPKLCSWTGIAKHWLALKDVSEDRIEAVLKRIEKDRSGKPPTLAMINKAIYGPTGKPKPASLTEEKLEAAKPANPAEKAVVDGAVLSSQTVSTTAAAKNDRPSAKAEAVQSKVEAVVEEVDEIPEPQSTVIAVAKPGSRLSADTVVASMLTKADAFEVLEALLKKLVEDGSEYSVSEICRKYVSVGESEPAESVSPAQHQMTVPASPLAAAATLDGNSVGAFASNLLNAIPSDLQEHFVTCVKKAWKVIGDKKFVPPTLDEVKEFFKQKGTHIDPVVFFEHYQRTGWKKSDKQPVKSLYDCLKTFERNQPVPHPTLDQVRKYCEEEKSNVNPDYFFHFYKSQNWRSKKTGWVRDWRSTLKTHENDPEFCRRIPTLEEVRRYVAEIGGKLPADKFFNCFQSRGWIDSGRAWIVDWKAKYKDFEKNPAWLQSAAKAEQTNSGKWKSVEVPEEYLKSNHKPQGGA